MQATILLQAALSLLVALAGLGSNVPPALQQQVITVANQAIAEANYEIAQQSMTDASSTSATVPVNNSDTTPGAVTAPVSAPDAGDASPSPASIEIVMVDNTHQLTDTWNVAPPSVTDPNAATSTAYLAQIGAVLRGPDGSVDRTSTMTVTADDNTQDKTIVGTGTFLGNPENVFYFPYQYLFKTAGAHTITFTANGVSKSVTLNAQ